jgi:hypothetical protein
MIKNNSIVIVLPIYQKKFNKTEIISLKQLRKKLSKKYKIIIITHEEMIPHVKEKPLLEGYPIKKLPKKNFTYQGYNKLLKSNDFYKGFKDFDYMLIYQTDCLAFGESLDYWIEKNYDYVGAPIFYKERGLQKHIIGNGGLSLRKIDSFIKVLEKRKSPIRKLIWALPYLPGLPRKVFNYLILKSHLPICSLITRNEDIFWSCEAKKFLHEFSIPKIKDACKFSIENNIKECFEINENKLPFGCHAFHRHLEAWNKFI